MRAIKAPAPLWFAFGGLVMILAAAWLAYAPGLAGGFLFDDFVNLNALGSSGPIDDWDIFWRYLTSGTADPGGRPLSLLSFLIDARNWPADPRPFLRTNLLLHLANGAMLFVLVRILEARLGSRAAPMRAVAIALLAAGAWLLHPLFVSTTLYAVQREAMLPATFTLLGLLGYVHGRIRFAETHGRRGLPTLCIAIVLGTACAMLSKANGILLPILAWVVEYTVFQRPQDALDGTGGSRAQAWKLRLLLVVPSACVLVYLAWQLSGWATVPEGRSWTVGQRVLTEGRVLIDYLHLLTVPRSLSSGLFNDNYRVSAGWLQPLSTSLAWLGIAALVTAAFRCRARFPAASAAILFFFAGHLLESTSLPLELYFEHRNYLPALLLGWPLARAISSLRTSVPLRSAIGVALLAMLAWTTHQRAEVWGDPGRLGMLWITTNPQSARAQTMVAMARIAAGRPREALQAIAPRWRQRPDEVQLAASYFVAACSLPEGLSIADKQALAATVRRAGADQATLFRWLERAAEVAAAGTCRGLGLEDVEAWAWLTGRHPATREAAAMSRESVLGRIELYRDRPSRALAHFDRYFEANPVPETAAIQSALLASRGYFEEALAHLDGYERARSRGTLRAPAFGMRWVHAKVLQHQGYWPREMQWLRNNFETARKQENPGP